MESALTSNERMGTAALAKLEFPAVLEQLARHCVMDAAAQQARSLTPETGTRWVRESLDTTEQALRVLEHHPDLSTRGIRDLRELAERAARGSQLLPQELLGIGESLAASRNLRSSLTRLDDSETELSWFRDQAVRLPLLPSLEADIGRSIGPAGDVLDSASDALARIRREVRSAHARLMERLNRIVSGGAYSSVLQDSIVTTRDGRYVVPVRADSRTRLPGVVHDVSASGQTVFVEPFDVVDLNNRWRESQIEEQREIDRILSVLSQVVGSWARELVNGTDAAIEVDVALAKARLAIVQRAVRPEVVEGQNERIRDLVGQEIEYRRARHPLLDPATVVPIDVRIGKDYRVLIVTGPNTGGKTVALKTVGLLAAMAQTGLFIPADEGSRTSVFSDLYVDIGDDQSIQQSLSTFSSHVTAIIAMLGRVDGRSLVLLDELGAGTDPQEGSALARAIIAALVEAGPLVMATTHYSEVKAFAYETEEVENASVEFDLETLSPTYRLAIGVPGQSNALAIAERLGMPMTIVEQARAWIDPEMVRADVLLEEIRERRDEADTVLQRARDLESASEVLQARARRELEEAEATRHAIRQESVQEAEALIAELRGLVRRLERSRDRSDQPAPAVPAAEVAKATARVAQARQRITPLRTPGGPEIRVGDRVEVRSLLQEGEVIGLEGDEAEVMLGTLKVRQPLVGLKRLGGPRELPARSMSIAPRSGPAVPIEIDIRGQRAADAEDEIDRYLDEAYRANLPFVRIIHGKGTGALRTAVRGLLRQHRAVSRFEPAGPTEGGEGATVAFLQE